VPSSLLPAGFWYNSLLMLKKFFDRKIWVILFASATVLMLVFLASGLGALHFQPGRPLAQGQESSTLQVSLGQIAGDIASIPLWKQVLFWVLVSLLVVIVASLLSPELRKKLLLFFLRFALFAFVLFYFLRHSQNISQVVEMTSAAGPQSSAPVAVDVAPPVFTPPQVPSMLLYLISLAVILALVAVAFLAGWWWKRHQRQPGFSQPLDDLAKIARTSLADISAGRKWEDVIIQCYVRMSAAAGAKRGLERRKDWSPAEFAARLEAAGLPGEAVRRLTRLFEAARYGKAQSSPAEVTEAVACLSAILSACGADS
jgi:hypothetical protein